MEKKKKKRLADVVKGVGDWERDQPQTLTSLKRLKYNQLSREQAVGDALKINKATYRGRAYSSERNPDYQGPLIDGGQGTKDRMPGTTPSNSLYHPKTKPTPKPSKSTKKKKKQDYI